MIETGRWIALAVAGCLVTSPASAGPLARSIDRAVMQVAARSEQDVPREAPEQVPPRRSRRRRHAVIGLLVGAGVGSVATVVHCRGKSASCNEVGPAYVLPLAGAGALIGALWR
jgi:hypothetical protein